MYYHDRMSLRNPQVRDVMAVEQAPRVDVRFSASFELLVGLYAACSPHEARERSWVPQTLEECPQSTRAALAAVGERSGELWLHLLGVALEAEAGFLSAVEALAPLELRRHLVGVHVPAWRAVAGKATLEAAARGDGAAARTLLAHPVYYAGRARESLETVLRLSASETKRRVLRALRTFAQDVYDAREAEVAEHLEADAREKKRLQASIGPLELIDNASGGYLYEVEPEFERVLLVPQLAARPWLLLCQHKRVRIICYPARSGDREPRERLLDVGRALGDPRRLALLERLRGGDASLAELADEVGLAKSTTHHHLHRLRAANLITLRGNAAGYRYALDPAGFADAERLLAEFPR
jgi:DNA-binding transcriptional ArsR family regulator